MNAWSIFRVLAPSLCHGNHMKPKTRENLLTNCNVRFFFKKKKKERKWVLNSKPRTIPQIELETGSQSIFPFGPMVKKACIIFFYFE